MRKYEPLKAGHPSIGDTCPACHKPFVEGDETTLVALGPGDDEKEQRKCAEGKAYDAVGALVHWKCSALGNQ